MSVGFQKVPLGKFHIKYYTLCRRTNALRMKRKEKKEGRRSGERRGAYKGGLEVSDHVSCDLISAQTVASERIQQN